MGFRIPPIRWTYRDAATRDPREMKAKGISGAAIWDVSAHRNPGVFVPAGPPVLRNESLEFLPGWWIKEGVRPLARLTSWAGSAEVAVKYFSGTATYTTTVELPEVALSNGNLFIDHGDAKETAEVFLNGKPLGIAWTPPYRHAERRSLCFRPSETFNLGGAAAQPGRLDM